MKWNLLSVALSICLGATTQSKAAEPTVPKKLVIIFGDSITKGEQLTSESERWASLVEARSQGKLQILNEGKGGRPTNALGEFEAMMKRHPQTDLLVIALGGNDARDVSGNCLPNALKNIKAMVSRARETYGAKLPILLVAPTNINKDALGPTKAIGPQREANLVALTAAYPGLAKDLNCDFVSTYGIVPQDTLLHDGVHPNAVGHEAIAKVMLPAILQAAGISAPSQNKADTRK